MHHTCSALFTPKVSLWLTLQLQCNRITTTLTTHICRGGLLQAHTQSPQSVMMCTCAAQTIAFSIICEPVRNAIHGCEIVYRFSRYFQIVPRHFLSNLVYNKTGHIFSFLFSFVKCALFQVGLVLCQPCMDAIIFSHLFRTATQHKHFTIPIRRTESNNITCVCVSATPARLPQPRDNLKREPRGRIV